MKQFRSGSIKRKQGKRTPPIPTTTTTKSNTSRLIFDVTFHRQVGENAICKCELRKERQVEEGIRSFSSNLKVTPTMKSEEFVEMVEKKDGISEFLKGERLSFCLFRGGPKREIVPLKGKSCLVLEELTKVGQAIELRSSRSNLPAGSSTDSSFSDFSKGSLNDVTWSLSEPMKLDREESLSPGTFLFQNRFEEQNEMFLKSDSTDVDPCERCGLVNLTEKYSQCTQCQNVYCLKCYDLPATKNPCMAAGMKHRFEDRNKFNWNDPFNFTETSDELLPASPLLIQSQFLTQSLLLRQQHLQQNGKQNSKQYLSPTKEEPKPLPRYPSPISNFDGAAGFLPFIDEEVGELTESFLGATSQLGTERSSPSRKNRDEQHDFDSMFEFDSAPLSKVDRKKQKSADEDLKKNSTKGSLKNIEKLMANSSPEGKYLSICNAASLGHVLFIKTLLDAGFDPLYTPKVGGKTKDLATMAMVTGRIEPVLHVAINFKQLEAVKVIVNYCPKAMFQKNKDKKRPLMIAISASKLDMCLYMLKREHFQNKKMKELRVQYYLKMCQQVVYRGRLDLFCGLYDFGKKDLDLAIKPSILKKWWVEASAKEYGEVVAELLLKLKRDGGAPYRVLTYEVIKELTQHNLKSPKVVINSPLLTSEVALILPWRQMIRHVQEIDFRNCNLKSIPLAMSLFDEKVKVRLEGNPLSGFSGNFLFYDAEKVIKKLKEVGETRQAKWDEVRLLIVGDAAVGKTSLIHALGSKLKEKEKRAPVVTDGIDTTEIEASGIKFLCMDFAGQEVYRYTHQLFLTSIGLYLIVFNVSRPESVSLKQILFWMESIVPRVSMGKLLLVGSHLKEVSHKVATHRLNNIQDVLNDRYGDIVASKILVDSVSGAGILQLKEELCSLASSIQVVVPLTFWDAYDVLKEMRSEKEEEKEKKVPMVKSSEFLGRLAERVGDLKARHFLRKFFLMGYVVYVESEKESAAVVIEPQWLADVFASVVTVRHGFVKDGIVSLDGLTHIWSDYPAEIHGALINILEQFDILHHIEKSARVIVPSLLPNEEPPLSSLWRKKSFGVKKRPSVFRSYLLKERGGLPSGIMGKILSSLFRMGEILQVWRNGCCIQLRKNKRKAKEGGQKEEEAPVLSKSSERGSIVVRVWTEWRGVSLGIFVGVFSSPFTSRATSIVRNLHNTISNLLSEYYHLPHTVISGADPEGRDAFEFDQIVAAIRNRQEFLVGQWSKKEFRVDALAPDLFLKDLGLIFISRDELELLHTLGSGGFGDVFAACYSPKNPSFSSSLSLSLSNSPLSRYQNKDKEIVAVKILHKVQETDEIGGVRLLKEIHREVFLLSALRHPNVIELKGLCVTESMPWIVMEVVDGGDVHDLLNDPFHLKSDLDFFQGAFAQVYLHNDAEALSLLEDRKGGKEKEKEEESENESGSEEEIRKGEEEGGAGEEEKDEEVENKRKKRERLKNFRVGLGKIEKVMNHHPGLVDLIPLFFQKSLCYMRERTKEAAEMFQNSCENISGKYESLLETMSPISWTTKLRIAADVAAGMNFIHNLDPPLLHRDLKSPNIFLTHSLVGKSDDSLAEREVLAKIGDFGLSAYLMGTTHFRQSERDDEEERAPIAPRWAAPELISGKFYTLKSDVYSMGLFLWELKYRKMAFHEFTGRWVNEEIKDAVIQGRRPSPVDESPYDLLAKRCWDGNPELRPTFYEIYQELRNIAKKDAPFLYANLPKPRARKTTQEINATFFCHLTMPNQSLNQISCMALSAEHVWVGCSSGLVGCFDPLLKDFEPVLSFPFQIPLGSPVNCIVFRNDTVWTGSANGRLMLWDVSPANGITVFEQSSLQSDVNVEGFRKQKSVQQPFASKLSLSAGCLSWGPSPLSVGEILRYEVNMEENSFIIFEADDFEVHLTFHVKDEAVKWGELMRWYETCSKAKNMLLPLGEVIVKEPGSDVVSGVLALKLIDAHVWSFDTSFRVTEWEIDEDITGLKEHRFSIQPRRSLSLSDVAPQIDRLSGCILSLGSEELWVSNGTGFLALQKSSFFDPGDSLVRNPSLSVSVGEGNQVLCACPVLTDQNQEVWVGSLQGIIVFDVETGEIVWKNSMKVLVVVLQVVSDEVWVGCCDGTLRRFKIATKKEIGLPLDKSHSDGISAIESSMAGDHMNVWVSGQDGQISVWKLTTT